MGETTCKRLLYLIGPYFYYLILFPSICIHGALIYITDLRQSPHLPPSYFPANHYRAHSVSYTLQVPAVRVPQPSQWWMRQEHHELPPGSVYPRGSISGEVTSNDRWSPLFFCRGQAERDFGSELMRQEPQNLDKRETFQSRGLEREPKELSSHENKLGS